MTQRIIYYKHHNDLPIDTISTRLQATNLNSTECYDCLEVPAVGKLNLQCMRYICNLLSTLQCERKEQGDFDSA